MPNLPAVASQFPLLSPEDRERFEETKRFLSDKAKERRRKKTPRSIRKHYEADGKTIEYTDRPEYQKFLDDNFPGWSVQIVNAWTDSGVIDNKTFPVCFNVSIQLVVNDNGVMRQAPGIGTAPISSKELTRNNTQLLKNKYSIALTNAIKVACGWFGAFFDLRVDEEQREREILPPTEEQNARFEKLMEGVAENNKEVTKQFWAKQTMATAEQFLTGLKLKVDALADVSKSI